MKVRAAFVSNSSSSSHIIACEPGVTPTFTVEMEIPESKAITTKEQLDQFVVDWYGVRGETAEWILENEPWMKKRYDKAIAALRDGKVVYEFVASNDYDDPVGNYVYSNGFPGNRNFEVLDNG